MEEEHGNLMGEEAEEHEDSNAVVGVVVVHETLIKGHEVEGEEVVEHKQMMGVEEEGEEEEAVNEREKVEVVEEVHDLMRMQMMEDEAMNPMNYSS